MTAKLQDEWMTTLYVTREAAERLATRGPFSGGSIGWSWWVGRFEAEPSRGGVAGWVNVTTSSKAGPIPVSEHVRHVNDVVAAVAKAVPGGVVDAAPRRRGLALRRA